MVMKALRLAAVASATAALAGCSVLGVDFTTEKVQYESSNSRAPLEIPPDLSSLPRTDRYTIPTRPQIVSANAEAAKAGLAAQKSGEAKSSVLPATVFAKVVRDGQTRFVHVNASAENVWPILQSFWPSVGLTVKSQNAETGVIQTEWAENKANLPKDIIRATIGKALDFVYDTGERDQYRARMERNDDGSTNIYITHRSMVEVLKGQNEDSTIWQPGPSDPGLEAEMLTRLAQKLELEFNPDAKPEEQKAVEALEEIKYVSVSKIVEINGVASEVQISEGFDRAWRRVSLALDRAGFEITDRDRSQGLFIVKYLDADYEARMKKEQGFFTNMFSKAAPIDPVEYQIRLMPRGEALSVLAVYGPDGRADTTGVAPKILTLIAEQTR